MIIINRELLLGLVKDAMSRNYTSLGRDVFQRNLAQLKIFGWKYDGYIRVIDSMKNYLSFNLELTDKSVRKALFDKNRPIFTKVADECPAKYGIDCTVKNSLIADGCIIEGQVENCVLFRGVRIGKGARLKNCVVMQSFPMLLWTRTVLSRHPDFLRDSSPILPLLKRARLFKPPLEMR